MLPTILDLTSLRTAYEAGTTPLEVIETVIVRRAASMDPAIFITPTPDDTMRAEARALMERAPQPTTIPLRVVTEEISRSSD